MLEHVDLNEITRSVLEIASLHLTVSILVPPAEKTKQTIVRSLNHSSAYQQGSLSLPLPLLSTSDRPEMNDSHMAMNTV